MKKFCKKHKFCIVIILIFFVVSNAFALCNYIMVSKSNGITIVVDAGHGGRDGGSVGKLGTVEKELNLEYAKLLKNKLVENGYRVILTRNNDDGLYSNLAKNKKVSDMNARMQIIKKANPSLVISLHMNSFADSSVCGANTYYKLDDIASKNCADLIQKSLNQYCGAKNSKSKAGDYFMLNCSYYTSVLIECGFLSNEAEEKLLKTNEYKEKIINAIYLGVMLYFGK